MTSFEQTALWNYVLPEDRIAAAPAERRSGSRLLVVPPTGSLQDLSFTALPDLLDPGDLLVVNDVRVTPARLHCARASGGRVEVLVVGFEGEGRWTDGRSLVAMHRSNRALQAGESLVIAGHAAGLRYVGPTDEGLSGFQVEGDVSAAAILDAVGALPLPPYILKRRSEDPASAAVSDAERYQTVFAREAGAVAAPTAGLHFDATVLGELAARGIERAAITLRVGAGTFRPVRAEDGLAGHRMHREHFTVPSETAEAVARARARGGRVVAVGTTVVRALEAAAGGSGATPELAVGDQWTELLIAPGHRFRVVDALITNFHLPRSTLLALVAAFGGVEQMTRAYMHAVASGYRFYSYGDAMFLPQCAPEVPEQP